MQSADLMFVPNPIPLGNRTRIVTAWSLGCPVVTHSANTLGMPDMVHRKNALTASNPEEIGESIIELLHNKELQEVLAENGRATFEELFEFNIAAKKISSDFLELM